MKIFIRLSIVVLLTFFIFMNVYCNNKIKFFNMNSLSTLKLIDSILFNPDMLHDLAYDTNYIRLHPKSWLNKQFYIDNIIEFLKVNHFNDYKIDELNVEGYKDDEGLITEEFSIEIISIKTKRKIIFIFDIIQPEENWKINRIVIY